MSEENLLTSNVNCSEWVWYEEWSPATIDGPAECIDAGWYCKNCFWSPNQELDLYFDNPEEKPKFNYCPNCGADMTTRHPTYYPGQKVEIDIEPPKDGCGSRTVNELCSNCIHKDVFWKNAGCNLKNGMEPCNFEPKEK